MGDSRFKNGHYEDALQYAKHILSSSSSIDEIVSKTNIKEEKEKDINNENK
ncbi:MAG: hypothetical protein RR942_00595 [Romboutsia sp.]